MRHRRCDEQQPARLQLVFFPLRQIDRIAADAVHHLVHGVVVQAEFILHPAVRNRVRILVFLVARLSDHLIAVLARSVFEQLPIPHRLIPSLIPHIAPDCAKRKVLFADHYRMGKNALSRSCAHLRRARRRNPRADAPIMK